MVGRVTEPDAGDGGARSAGSGSASGPDGPVLADVPAASLADDAPRYDRPLAPPADLDARRADGPDARTRRGLRRPTCSPCWPTRPGSTASTTTSCS